MFLIFAVPTLSETANRDLMSPLSWSLWQRRTRSSTCHNLAMPAEMVEELSRALGDDVLPRVFHLHRHLFGDIAGAPALLGLFQDGLGMSQRVAYGWMGFVVGCLVTIAMIASFYGTRNAPMTMHVRKPMSVGQQIKLLNRNKPFLTFPRGSSWRDCSPWQRHWLRNFSSSHL